MDPLVWSSTSSHFAVALSVLGMGCAWSVGLSTEIFLSDGATKKSIRRGLGKIALLVLTTIAACTVWHFATALLFLLTSLIHLFDLKATSNRWMSGRIAPITGPLVLAVNLACGLLLGQQPLFFAVLTLVSSALHVLKMRRRQTEFFQNFQLLRDRMATLEAQQHNPAAKTNEPPLRGSRDNHAKAG